MTMSNGFLAALNKDVEQIIETSKEIASRQTNGIKLESATVEITCQLGTTKGGDPAVELIFSGPIDKEMSSRLKEQKFGYSPALKLWRSFLNEEQVIFAKDIATIDNIGEYPVKEVKEEPKVSDMLQEYKASLETLAECWGTDITDAMMRAVIEKASEL